MRYISEIGIRQEFNRFAVATALFNAPLSVMKRAEYHYENRLSDESLAFPA